MKNRLIAIFATLLLASAPFAAFAMDHGHGGEHMAGEDKGHGGHGEHGGMAMEDGTIMLGEQTKDGVKAIVHLKDVKEAMGKMGMKETHHFMVMFTDEATGKPIEEGTVAVKIKTPEGKEGAPVSLMGMQGHFGADVVMAQPGEYHFKVGTKLEDGKKRQYHLHYDVK
ncbi:hypothetical protein DESUT3_21490 [Desulfuromonas versatilis]|uniref:YtkA-like domain-containing protein n=1 Tax=Desulfuromonas versatilis TaxID=2802975 RepID=A0ABM8HWX6_9BACT|nr:hypothetical protein [Desulfuromonas versatilis]BCR05080.1 hypothetical protein DESUT3_21490 [Desulfuromonas versatilis]